MTDSGRRYTSESPTKPGRYWYRNLTGNPAERDEVIVECIVDPSDGLLKFRHPRYDHAETDPGMIVRQAEGEWAPLDRQQQFPLVDRKPHELTRKTHPQQSLRAAEEIQGSLGPLQTEAVEMVRRHPRQTTKEIAKVEGLDDNRRLGRRLPELVEAGRVRRAGVRRCSLTNRNAETWEVEA